MYYIGFDIGGSSVEAALVKNKTIEKTLTRYTPENFEDLLKLMVGIKNELASGIEAEQLGGIGVGVAGALDLERESILNSPNIQYLNGLPLRRLFEENFGHERVKIEHDVHCFLLAEKEFGAAKDYTNIIYITIGMGVGGALMVGGEIQRGAHGAAGEIGHMIIDAKGMLDFEDLTANKYVKDRLGVSAAQAEQMVRSGDQKAKEVFEERAKNIGLSLANLINIFDPEAIIISGGVKSAKDLLYPLIQEQVEKYVLSPAAKQTKILFSELGQFAGAFGAALLFEVN